MSNLYRCILPSFGSFGQAVSEKIFRNRLIRNRNCLWWPCLLMDRDEMSNRYRCILQSFGTFGQAVSEKIFKNRPIRNKNCLWQPCLLTDQNDISNRNRGLSIDASYQVSVHLAKQFRGEEFLKSANQKQESPVAAMFVNGSGRIGMSNLYRGPSIDAFYQVSVHLAKRLQKRRIFKISQSET